MYTSCEPMPPDHPSPTVLELVRRRAPTWFPELGAAVDVAVARHDRRARGSVSVVTLSAGRTVRRIVVKSAAGGPATPLPDRPRLGIGNEDLLRRDELEWNGLERAWAACGDGHRPGLTAVRPLAHVADERTVVMSHLDGRTLRSLLAGGSRASALSNQRRVDPGSLPAAVRRAGAWLACFHAQGAGVEVRRAEPDELASVATSYERFLGTRCGADDGGTQLARLLVESTPATPPPLGLGHGDFAPRNAVVTAAGEVAVLDVLGRWRVPVYEDLALLLLELRTGGLQLLSGGHAFSAASLRSLKASLLEGYEEVSGTRIEDGPLRWFTGLVLVDRCAAQVTRPPAGVAARLRHALVGRGLDREVKRLLLEVEGVTTW
jgi:hypothetical protein